MLLHQCPYGGQADTNAFHLAANLKYQFYENDEREAMQTAYCGTLSAPRHNYDTKSRPRFCKP